MSDLGPVGNIFLADMRRDPHPPPWFTMIPAAELERIIAEMNAWSLHVVDVVEPKSIAPDGSVAAWRFAKKDNPVSDVVSSRPTSEVGEMTVKTVISLVHERPAGASDEKEFILNAFWTPANGHEAKIRPWFMGTKFSINVRGMLSADPALAQTAPTTRPAGRAKE
ncbi:MAG TPA: hypothetical protein VGI81_17435 [Tepidisphaeraceae bacterium]